VSFFSLQLIPPFPLISFTPYLYPIPSPFSPPALPMSLLDPILC
jgi:hypothetical protein